MLELLILYRNELSNKSIYNYKLLGILAELVMSPGAFPTNSDAVAFLKELFPGKEKVFTPYVLKSRSQILARACKLIVADSDNRKYAKKILAFVRQKIDALKKDAK